MSVVPSPLGEKIPPTALGASVGAVVSTTTGNERVAWLPATSHVASETV